MLIIADTEDLGDFNLMNSSERSKTYKKYREIDNHFKEVFGGPVDTVVAL